ncbi:hypothetical protein EPH_0055430 [Eimeria praecox]|uniref:Uncharacterized protein n=1 Tax=Eimeria praecox TaxID=51316 RepID=U6H8P2_9EIME|nr:hypothetical protein EPH_0055430 [Eimeria praecox]
MGRVVYADIGQDNGELPVQLKGVQQGVHAPIAFDVSWNGLERQASTRGGRAAGSDDNEAREAGELRLHPFVRLPMVNPEDVRRSFRVQFALSFQYGKASPMETYMTMRSLFAKASLTAQDVETLMLQAEILANYATDKLGRPHSRCTANYLVMKLASLLMVFDHLVCAIELLGEKMNTGSWWPEFVSKFRTDYLFPEAARTKKMEMLNKMVNRLSSALAIYKTGKRPPLKDVVELKRAILAHHYKGRQLSHPLWRLWLQDDKEFSSSGYGSGNPSDFPVNGKAATKEA